MFIIDETTSKPIKKHTNTIATNVCDHNQEISTLVGRIWERFNKGISKSRHEALSKLKLSLVAAYSEYLPRPRVEYKNIQTCILVRTMT